MGKNGKYSGEKRKIFGKNNLLIKKTDKLISVHGYIKLSDIGVSVFGNCSNRSKLKDQSVG